MLIYVVLFVVVAAIVLYIGIRRCYIQHPQITQPLMSQQCISVELNEFTSPFNNMQHSNYNHEAQKQGIKCSQTYTKQTPQSTNSPQQQEQPIRKSIINYFQLPFSINIPTEYTVETHVVHNDDVNKQQLKPPVEYSHYKLDNVTLSPIPFPVSFNNQIIQRDSLNDPDPDQDCLSCGQTILTTLYNTPCNHKFHKKCLKNIINQHQTNIVQQRYYCICNIDITQFMIRHVFTQAQLNLYYATQAKEISRKYSTQVLKCSTLNCEFFSFDTQQPKFFCPSCQISVIKGDL